MPPHKLLLYCPPTVFKPLNVSQEKNSTDPTKIKDQGRLVFNVKILNVSTCKSSSVPLSSNSRSGSDITLCMNE